MYDTDVAKNYCSCLSWRFQRLHPRDRSCKHLRALQDEGRESTKDEGSTKVEGSTKDEGSTKALGKKYPAPKLMLFSTSLRSVVSGWRWSEKFDGIRALWTGDMLLSRGGIELSGYTWALPKGIRLDGEMWSPTRGREGAMDTLYGLWGDVQFMVFDSPSAPGTFEERYAFLAGLDLNTKDTKGVVVVVQYRLESVDDLDRILAAVVNHGGEGIIIRDGGHEHYVGRKANGVKMKPMSTTKAVKQKNGTFVERWTQAGFQIRSKVADSVRPGVEVLVQFSGRTSSGKPEFPSLTCRKSAKKSDRRSQSRRASDRR